MNLNKEGLLPDRLNGERPPTLSGPHPRGRRPEPNTSTTTQTSATSEQTEGEDPQNRFAAELISLHANSRSPLWKPLSPRRILISMHLCPVVCTLEWVFCVARKPATVEAERLGRNNQPEPQSGASEQSHNGTRPKRYWSRLYWRAIASYYAAVAFCCCCFFRTAPVPKYLKVHYVKEETGEGKGVFWNRIIGTISHPASDKTLSPLLSLSWRHFPSTSPPRVCVLPWHLRLPPTPGGSLLGQTLPAAAWGPGADCQESGHLELRGGQTCLHTPSVSTHEKQMKSSLLSQHEDMLLFRKSTSVTCAG